MDDDLFDVFDAESSKSKKIVLPSAEAESEPAKVDPGSLIKEICGAKRPVGAEDAKDEGAESKKIKTFTFNNFINAEVVPDTVILSASPKTGQKVCLTT